MIRILDRYIVVNFMRLFLLFALMAPLLFIIFDIADNLDRLVERGLDGRAIALNYVYQFPQFVLWAFPIAALIATIFTVSVMTRHSEVAAAKAGGVSFFRLYAALPVLGVLLTVAGLGLAELVPVTIRKQAEVLGERPQVVGSRTNFVFRGEEGHVLVIPRLEAEAGRITNPRLERGGNRDEGLPTIHALADVAIYDREREGWDFNDGYYRLVFDDGASTTFGFRKLRTRGFEQKPEELMAVQREPDEMGWAELGRFIRSVERSGGRAEKLKVERAQKLAIPVATLVIVLFGAPLATASPRSGAAYGIGIALAVTITYLMLFQLSGALGSGGAMPPAFAAWLPNFIFFGGALVLLTRVRS